MVSTSMALTSALAGGLARDPNAADHGFPGRLGASVRVWMGEFGTPDVTPTGLAWPMDDGMLVATIARLSPDEAADPVAEPVVHIERHWSAGREPDLSRALEVAESLLPGDARPREHAWLPMPEEGRPLAGLHVMSWQSALELCCPMGREGCREACPYGGGVSLVIKELAPDVIAAFWLVATRRDGLAAS
jgi:hypothetical protein